jgi:hypothetical protein
METHSLGIGDSFDETLEELTPVALTAVIGIPAAILIALAIRWRSSRPREPPKPPKLEKL